MWGTFLSEPLPIDALVSRYLTSKLIGRIPITRPEKNTFSPHRMTSEDTMGD